MYLVLLQEYGNLLQYKMKRVTWEDERGWLHVSLLRDNDGLTRPEIGIPQDPPSLESVFENAEKELHNELVRRGLLTWRDVNESQNGITSAILTVFKSQIILLYKSKEIEDAG